MGNFLDDANFEEKLPRHPGWGSLPAAEGACLAAGRTGAAEEVEKNQVVARLPHWRSGKCHTSEPLLVSLSLA